MIECIDSFMKDLEFIFLASKREEMNNKKEVGGSVFFNILSLCNNSTKKVAYWELGYISILLIY